MIQTYDVNDLDNQFINEIIDIDASVYPESHRGTFEEVFSRYKANRDMFMLLYADGKLAGYLCMFPIKPSFYEYVRNENRLFDSDIPSEVLEQYVPFHSYKLYLISVAIRPEYQKKGLSKHLRDSFHQFIDRKKAQNIDIVSVLASSISDEGRVFLDKLNFKKIKQLSAENWLHELEIKTNFQV